MKKEDEGGEVAKRYEEGKKSFQTLQKMIFTTSMIVIVITIAIALIVWVAGVTQKEDGGRGGPFAPETQPLTVTGPAIVPGDPDLTWFGETLKVEIRGEQECSPWITILPGCRVNVDKVDASTNDWRQEYRLDDGSITTINIAGNDKERKKLGTLPSRTFRICGQGTFLVFQPSQ